MNSRTLFYGFLTLLFAVVAISGFASGNVVPALAALILSGLGAVKVYRSWKPRMK